MMAKKKKKNPLEGPEDKVEIKAKTKRRKETE